MNCINDTQTAGTACDDKETRIKAQQQDQAWSLNSKKSNRNLERSTWDSETKSQKVEREQEEESWEVKQHLDEEALKVKLEHD